MNHFLACLRDVVALNFLAFQRMTDMSVATQRDSLEVDLLDLVDCVGQSLFRVAFRNIE